jgi:hypothetical protein
LVIYVSANSSPGCRFTPYDVGAKPAGSAICYQAFKARQLAIFWLARIMIFGYARGDFFSAFLWQSKFDLSFIFL